MTEFSELLMKAGYTVPEAAKALGYSEGYIYRFKRGQEVPRDAVMELLRMKIAARCPEAAEGSAYRFIDLFAGIGGLRRAMDSAGGVLCFH